jgi:nitrous oxide reductase accessory protein NosL
MLRTEILIKWEIMKNTNHSKKDVSMKSTLFLVAFFATTFGAIEKPATCAICGMDRDAFAYSRAVVVFEGNDSIATCSIACAHAVADNNTSKKIASIYIADYNTKALINAKTALWVIGGDKKGVMALTAAWAFGDSAGAKKFIAAHGGKLAAFHDVWGENKGPGPMCKCKAGCKCKGVCKCGTAKSGKQDSASLIIGKDKKSEALAAGGSDKCPVCGMFVAKYPGFLGQIQFNDGKTVFFDGPKDLFKYYLTIEHYAPGKKTSAIARIFVTDYYSQQPINGLDAQYVIGSDINGPMGRELVPFENLAGAQDFKKDHKGISILGFKDITEKIIASLGK